MDEKERGKKKLAVGDSFRKDRAKKKAKEANVAEAEVSNQFAQEEMAPVGAADSRGNGNVSLNDLHDEDSVEYEDENLNMVVGGDVIQLKEVMSHMPASMEQSQSVSDHLPAEDHLVGLEGQHLDDLSQDKDVRRRPDVAPKPSQEEANPGEFDVYSEPSSQNESLKDIEHEQLLAKIRYMTACDSIALSDLLKLQTDVFVFGRMKVVIDNTHKYGPQNYAVVFSDGDSIDNWCFALVTCPQLNYFADKSVYEIKGFTFKPALKLLILSSISSVQFTGLEHSYVRAHLPDARDLHQNTNDENDQANPGQSVTHGAMAVADVGRKTILSLQECFNSVIPNQRVNVQETIMDVYDIMNQNTSMISRFLVLQDESHLNMTVGFNKFHGQNPLWIVGSTVHLNNAFIDRSFGCRLMLDELSSVSFFHAPEGYDENFQFEAPIRGQYRLQGALFNQIHIYPICPLIRCSSKRLKDFVYASDHVTYKCVKCFKEYLPSQVAIGLTMPVELKNLKTEEIVERKLFKSSLEKLGINVPNRWPAGTKSFDDQCEDIVTVVFGQLAARIPIGVTGVESKDIFEITKVIS